MRHGYLGLLQLPEACSLYTTEPLRGRCVALLQQWGNLVRSGRPRTEAPGHSGHTWPSCRPALPSNLLLGVNPLGQETGSGRASPAHASGKCGCLCYFKPAPGSSLVVSVTSAGCWLSPRVAVGEMGWIEGFTVEAQG